MTIIETYFIWMLVYFGAKYVVIGFLEGANIDITIKHIILYPVFAARDIGYSIGRIAIFVVGVFLN